MKGKNGMESYTEKKENNEKKLKELIMLCVHNIKGLIPKETVEHYLPIEIEEIKIYEIGTKIVFEKEQSLN